MAAAATRTPSRSSTRKAAHAQMSRQAPAQTSAHNGRENQTHGQRRAGRMVHGQITQESVCAVEISLRKPCTKRHPARRTKRTVSGTPHQTDGIRHATPNGRYPARHTKRTVSGTPQSSAPESPPKTYISPLPRTRNLRGADFCAFYLHNIIYITIIRYKNIL